MAEFKAEDLEVEKEEQKEKGERKRLPLPPAYLIGLVLGGIAIFFALFGRKEEIVVQSGGEVVEEQFKRFEESYRRVNEELLGEIKKLREEVSGLREEIAREKKEEATKREQEPSPFPSQVRSFPSPPSVQGREGAPQAIPPFPSPPKEEVSPEAGWKEVSYRVKFSPSIRVRSFTTSSLPRGKKKGGAIYLPAGTLLKVRLIGNVTAPTIVSQGGTGLPVAIFEVKDVVLPNRRKAPVKGCFLVGKAFGNWNRQRVDVQAVALSCTTPEGVMEARVNGWVKGADENDGLVGKVEYMRGREIAFYFSSVFLRSFASGMAQAQTEQQTSTSPSGTTTTTVVRNAFTYSMWKSIEESVKAMTDFYVQNADQMFPVVRADSQDAYVVFVNSAVLKEVKINES